MTRSITTWRASSLLPFVLAISFVPGGAQADTFLQSLNPFPVIADGDTLPYPFYGGWHQVKAHFRDMDADGDYDLLMVRQKPDPHVTYWRNDGTAQSPKWTVAAEPLEGIEILSWIEVVDMDNDGDFDILGDGISQIQWFENVGTPQRPIFERKPDQPGLAELTIFPGFEFPRFHDLDNDGDLDYAYLAWRVATATVHQNFGTPEEPDFGPAISRYGDFDTFQDPGDDKDRSRHGNSSLTIADVNNDSLPDFLVGDLNNRSLWYFANASDSLLANDTLTAVMEAVTGTLMPDRTIGRNFSNLVDLDGDGVRELFINPEDITGYGAFRVYERPSEETIEFSAIDTNFVDGIEAGLTTRPALVDLNGDGLLDIVIGTGDASRGVPGSVLYYRNTGTPGQPSFEKVSTIASPFSGVEASLGKESPITLSFGDLDGDGDYDFFAGAGSDLYRYENIGSAAVPTFAPCSGEDCIVPGPSVDDFAAPALGDVDNDGDLDLLVGERGFSWIPNIFYYRNDGDSSHFDPKLVTDNNDLGVIDLPFDPFESEDRVVVPCLSDGDGDGVLELLIGYQRGRVLRCQAGSAGGALYRVADSLYAGIDVGNGAAPAAGDIDGDGDWDLLVGEESGGLNALIGIYSGLAGVRLPDGSIELSWSGGFSSGVNAFDVLRAPTGGELQAIGSITSAPEKTSMTYLDDDVDSAIEYKYAIRAVFADTTLVGDSTYVAVGPFNLEEFEISLGSDTAAVNSTWEIEFARSDIGYVLRRSSTFAPSPVSIDYESDTPTTFFASDESVIPGNRWLYELFKVDEGDTVALTSDSIEVPLPFLAISDPVTSAEDNGIAISWTVNRSVASLTFDLYRGPASGTAKSGEMIKVNAEPISGNTSFAFLDPTGSYREPEEYVAVPHYENAGTRTEYPAELNAGGASVTTPLSFAIGAIKPHPFQAPNDGEMRIGFDLPAGGRVTARVYDIAGRLVREIHDDHLDAGPSRELFWDGENDAGNDVIPGVYFIRVEAGREVDTRKVVLYRN